MMANNFKLILITQNKDIAEENRLLNNLFEAGLQLLHIRKPTHTIQETRTLLKSIPPIFHPKIVLHNHYELLTDFKLKGAHLPEKIRKAGNINLTKNIVSTSFHALEDIKTEKLIFEYAFFSPVFKSISKQGYEPSIESTQIKDFFKVNRNKIKSPNIALGGITDKNILQLQDMGFAGAACIGYIWENTDPVTQLKKLQKIIES